MTLNLLSIPQLSYNGQPFNVPYNAGFTSRVNPQSCIATINWEYYAALATGTDVSVIFNVGSAPAAALDIVKSVIIDNTGNLYPVYVIFPDTGYTVLCQANSTRVANVQSSSITPLICCPGIVNADQNYYTTVYFSNVVLPPENGLQPQPGYVIDSSGNLVPAIASDKIASCITDFNNSNEIVIAGIVNYQLYNIISAINLSLVTTPAGGTYGFQLIGTSSSFVQTFGINVTAATLPGQLFSASGLRLKSQVAGNLTFKSVGPNYSASGAINMTVYYGVAPK